MDWDVDAARRFGARLHSLRRERGYTQERLANLADVTKNHVQLLESGISSTRDRGAPSNPRMSTVYRLAAALGVDPTDLLDPPDARDFRRTS